MWAGEHLGVCPGNQPALVQGILERVVDGPAPHQTVRLEALDESGKPQARESVLPGILRPPHLAEGLDLGLPVTAIPALPAERVGRQSLCKSSRGNSPSP
ncbi:nitric oxide synthase, inducible-like [Papio anubis]|uniref:nitric oxide synthase, inducible-like n=1 Tax=Papio anubis TaxID=9555 RepID=UPI0012AE1C7D|nr:nitric oxide synthase, inducible-like [Papio anubis]